MAFIGCAEAKPCDAVWLAGETACENINCVCIDREIGLFDIAMASGIGEVVAEYGLAKWVVLAPCHRLPAHEPSSILETAYTGEEAELSHG